MVQGIASLDATQPQQPQTSPEAVAALGKAFTSLSVEELTQLRNLSDDLKQMAPDAVKMIDQIIQFMKENGDTNYDEAVQVLVTKGIIQPGDLPPDYVPSFFDILDGMVKEAISSGGSAAPAAPEMPQEQLARGGIAGLQSHARRVQAAGSGRDKVLAHINPEEAAMLHQTRGSSINPKTGLPEFGLFDSIGNFFKKAAGIVLPVALGFMGVPPIFAGAIGSGLGAMINGAKPQDALGAALMGGIGGAAYSGISGMASGQGFMAGVQQGFSPANQGMLSDTFGGYKNPAVAPTVASSSMAPKDYIAGSTLAPGTTAASNAVGAGSAMAPTGFLDQAKNFVSEHPYITAAGAGLAGLALAGSGGEGKGFNKSKYNGPSQAMIDAQRFAPGSFAQYTAPRVNVVPTYSPAYAARGGEIDARIGGHLSGPGTGTSDSIPAKLSDGEFVMTAKAVRGAGGGDRKAGAKRMYQLMHQFERGAR